MSQRHFGRAVLRASAKELPELTSVPVPSELDPQPRHDLAGRTKSPSAMPVALIILSEKGRAIVGRQGLLPAGEPVSLAR
jgi:hypothetical protein